jgi:hypothetical protein
MAAVPKPRYTRAEQKLAIELMADAVRRGQVRTLKQLEKFGFVYRPSQALAREGKAAPANKPRK